MRKKASNHKDCYCMSGKTWIEKIGSRMFVTVFFNLGFYFLNKKERRKKQWIIKQLVVVYGKR
ncbi:hypothetical protein FIU56_00335 [Enterococcus faecium]|nr:hypothetical protein FIU56_00335 [Enterococcus faecium]